MKKILCVAPYQGLNILFQQVSRDLIKEMADGRPSFDFIQFDRQDDLNIIIDMLQKHYDLIISRGGTATLLKKITKTPVIDIGVSQYDLLSTIQSASRLPNIAIVAFKAFTQRAKAVLDRFHLSIVVYGISNENELSNLLRTLDNQNIDTLICDTTTQVAAQSAGFTTLLITASEENVATAISNGLLLLEQIDTQHKAANALAKTLDRLNVPTITMVDEHEPFLMSPSLIDDEQLQQAALNAINKNHEQFTLNTIRYKLTSYPNGELTVYTLDKWEKSQVQGNSEEMSLPMDSALKNAFDAYFKLTQPPAFLNLIQAYARLNRPILIVGELGSGKNYIADQLHINGFQSEQIIQHVDMGRVGALDKLMNKNNSTLYESGQCFVFEGLNRADATSRRNLVEFTLQTKLASRNQVIFTFKQSPDDGMAMEIKPLLDYARMLTLEPFRSITGDKVIQLLTGMINSYNKEHGTAIIGVSDIALDFILNEPWPENFDQFYHVLNIAIASTDQDYIGIDEIRMALSTDRRNRFMQNHQPTRTVTSVSNGQTLAEMAQEAVVSALMANNNNRTKTAKMLGISRATLWRYLK